VSHSVKGIGTDNVCLAGPGIRPFEAANATGTNLAMFNNLYFYEWGRWLIANS
jgi:hypothetical protein